MGLTQTIQKIVLGFLSLFSSVSFAQEMCTPGEIRTEQLLLASTEKAWNLLMDTANYRSWHPYISCIKGELLPGKKIRVFVFDSIKGRSSFRANVIELLPSEQLSWGGKIGAIFSAKHYFVLKPISKTSCLFIQGEYWRGWFGKMYGRRIYQSTYSKFKAMNSKMALLLTQGF